MHRRTSFAYARNKFRNVLTDCADISRTAGCSHNLVSARHTFLKFTSLFFSAYIRPKRNFKNYIKTGRKQCRFKLCRLNFKLACNCRGIKSRYAPVFLHDMLYYVNKLAFVHHSAKRTFPHAVAAENALVIVNNFMTVSTF